MTPEEYIAKLEEEVESRKEYQQRSQSADGEQIERLLGEKYKLEEENKKLNIKVASLEGEIKGLNSVIEKLKEENQTLEECECSFGFENDEVGYRKREYKRLKKWIKDHCNGYGNLFPEDEMKRQWKKADKKRK